MKNQETQQSSNQQPKKRGFAAMSAEKRRAIASSGGKKAHALGTAHKYNSVSGAAAGQKGGAVVSKNREFMREIGRRGAQRRRENIAMRALLEAGVIKR